MSQRQNLRPIKARLAALFVAALQSTLFTGCATRGVAPGTPLADMSLVATTEASATPRQQAIQIFQSDLLTSIQDTTDNGKALAAYQSGIIMLDLECSRYLDAIGSANQSASNERRQLSLVGGFASAIMGLTGSSAKEISGVATTFSFAGSSMESFTNAFLFSDAASSITKIVKESRSAWLSDINSQDRFDKLQSLDVIHLLGDYEQICRPAQIRSLIDQSIDKGTIVAERVATSDADVVMILQSLQSALGEMVTEEEAIVLYAWLKNPGQRTAGAALSTTEPIASLLVNRTSPELAAQLSRGFLPVLLAKSTVTERWEEGIKNLLNPVPLPAAPAPSPASASAGAGNAGITPSASAPASPTANGVRSTRQKLLMRRPTMPVLRVR
ncbi:hypothetical protein [Pseudoduganella lutea]|uniref:Uncharacterized protein n=1 Tax=Pseudoduganella lutea TaxID=321985 RepID=A0A4P6L3D2_9BURK|nr:hypothetical protein [Pseudoduganella lutea]QBE65914.1 hypothetical protein EWM63_25445 [Pseudoduganella lutea]